MMGFFYFDPAPKKYIPIGKAGGQFDAGGTWGTMNKTQPAITGSFYCQVGPADVAEWPVSRLVEYTNCR